MNKLKKYLSIFLVITLLITGMGINGAVFDIFAAEEKVLYTATVNVNDILNVRAGPGTTYNTIGSLKPNATVNIYSEKTDNGWYKIGYGTGYGYVSADYLKNIKPVLEYDYDADFETNLTKQGFPESYKVKLRELHANHPNWIFTADHLSMTWAEAVKNESTVGKSLIQNVSSTPDSYKSMMKDAYNWDKGNYIAYDSGNWVTCEPDLVAYYMEPRNFLNENYIYMFLDQSYNPNLQNSEGLQKILKGTFMEGEFPEDTYETWNDVIMDAAKQSGVSPYVLAASIIIEQGTRGTGGSIKGTIKGFEGIYNFFNVRAYASGGYDAVTYGLMYAAGEGSLGRPWNTRAKSIIGGAAHYANGYVKRGQDTLYYKKYNVITPTYYINQYMTNVQGAYLETGKLKNAYSSVSSDAALTFAIPVFKSMPEVNSTKLPTEKGANNYYLLSLKVDGKSVDNFDKYVNSYEMIVPSSTKEITVAATVQSTASVSGAGKIALKEGKNTITLTVTAASKKTAKYTLSVFREEGSGDSGNPGGGEPEPTIPDPTVTGKYPISTYVSGVKVGTTVSDFIKNFGVKDGTAKLFGANGKEKTSGVIATGDQIAVYDNKGVQRLKYNIIIFGDTNGDGKISLVDLARVQKHLLGVTTLKGNQSTAADANRDGKLSILDLARVQKHLLELTEIKQ